MNKLTGWQIVLIALFILITIVAVLIFAGVLPGYYGSEVIRPSGSADTVSFWGPLSESSLASILDEFKNQYGILVNYRELPRAGYAERITDALASGVGPDMWLLAEDELLRNISKIYINDTSVYPERSFKDGFLDEAADLLILAGGYAGFPMSADPLILYWNRALFRSDSVALPPKNWREFSAAAQKLTKIDSLGNILQSGAALGEFANVRNAKDILSLFMLQSGNPIVEISRTEESQGVHRTKLSSALSLVGSAPLPAAESAARFFADFADPRKTSYSWSRVLPDSQESFIQGRLAMYIGFASEYREITAKNPHLDFDVAEIPQISSGLPAGSSLLPASGFGRLNIMVLAKQSPPAQRNAAINLMSYLALDTDAQKQLAENLSVAPVLRSLLANPPAEANANVTYNAAIKARGWLDPDSQATETIFKELVGAALSKRELLRDAVDKANSKLEALVEPIRL